MSDPLPAIRRVPWVPGVNVGVQGMIDQYLPGGANQRLQAAMIDATAAPYSIDNTGATDQASVIRAAQAAAVSAGSSCKGVWLGGGTIRVDSYCGVGQEYNGKTTRGAGSGNLTIDSRCSTFFGIATDAVVSVPEPVLNVVSGATKGSAELVLSYDPGWSVGQYILLLVQNDASLPVVTTYNYDVFTNESPQRQLVQITDISGTDITIDPPFYADQTGLEIRVVALEACVEGVGLEGMTVDSENFTSGGGAQNNVGITGAKNCWLLDIVSKHALNYGMGLNTSLYCTIRSCYSGDLKGNGSNGAGLLVSAWGCLVENSRFENAFPNGELNNGSAANAFVYNFGNADWTTNHSAHNRFNIYEGNAFNFAQSDGYGGSESDATFHRNYFWANAAYGTISMRRFSRRFTILGCGHGASVLGSQGLPNRGNTDYTGTAQLSAGDPWRDYQMAGNLTTRTSATVGEFTVTTGGLLWYSSDTVHNVYIHWGSGAHQSHCQVTAWDGTVASMTVVAGENLPTEGTAVTFGPGSFYENPGGTGSYQELDLDVAATTIDEGNFYIGSSTLTPLGGDTLPDGYVYTEAPPWWPEGFAFPPFDTSDPSTLRLSRLPAGQRYLDDLPPAPPEITSANSAKAFFGEPFSFSINTDVPADSYSASGLPGWASLNTSTGVISGTPNAISSDTVTLTSSSIANGDGTPQTFTLDARATRTARITCLTAGAVAPVAASAAFTVSNEYDGHN